MSAFVSDYLFKNMGIVSSVEDRKCLPVKELAAMLTVQCNKITSPSRRLTTHYKRFEFPNLRVPLLYATHGTPRCQLALSPLPCGNWGRES